MNSKKKSDYYSVFVYLEGRHVFTEDYTYKVDAVRAKLSWEAEGEEFTAEILPLSNSNLFDIGSEFAVPDVDRLAY
jgi:hypothetical protein